MINHTTVLGFNSSTCRRPGGHRHARHHDPDRDQRLHAQNRTRYGITDGPAYQDLDNPGGALFHIRVDDIDTAMAWFRSDTFKQASKLAKVTGRSFYLAQSQT